MVRFNIKWKYALSVPIDYEGFDRSLLVYLGPGFCKQQRKDGFFKRGGRSGYRFYPNAWSSSCERYL